MINENEKPNVISAISRLGKSPFFMIAAILYIVFVMVSAGTLVVSLFEPEEYSGVVGIDVVEIIVRLVALIGFVLLLMFGMSGKKNGILTGLTVMKLFCAVYGVYTVLDSVLTSIMTTENLPSGISLPFLFGAQLDIDYVILIPCLEIYLTVIRVAFYFMIFGFLERVAQSLRTEEAMPDDGKGLTIFMIIINASNLIAFLFNFIIDGYLTLGGIMQLVSHFLFLAVCVMMSLWIVRYRAAMSEVYNSNVVVPEE